MFLELLKILVLLYIQISQTALEPRSIMDKVESNNNNNEIYTANIANIFKNEIHKRLEIFHWLRRNNANTV